MRYGDLFDILLRTLGEDVLYRTHPAAAPETVRVMIGPQDQEASLDDLSVAQDVVKVEMPKSYGILPAVKRPNAGGHSFERGALTYVVADTPLTGPEDATWLFSARRAAQA